MEVYKKIITPVLLSFITGCVTATTLTRCQDRWTAYKGSCYLAGHQSVDFTEAEQFCRQHGAHLVHVNNEDENNFIKKFVGDLPANSWWLGLTDETVEDYWTWFDTDTIANFTDFHPTEPNHDGDCALLYYAFRFDWIDVDCLRRFRPFCEINSQVINVSPDVVVG